MFSLFKKARALLLPLDLQIELFQKTVKFILLYVCEVWGFRDLKVLEQVQLKFLKQSLNLKKKYSKMYCLWWNGVLPHKVDIQSRMIGYWSKLVSPVSSNVYTELCIIAKSYFDSHRYSNSFTWLLKSETF